MTPRFSLLAYMNLSQHESLQSLVKKMANSCVTNVRPERWLTDDSIDRGSGLVIVNGVMHHVVGREVSQCGKKIGKTDLLGLLGLGTALSAGSLLGLALLQKGLGNEDLVLGGNGAVQC